MAHHHPPPRSRPILPQSMKKASQFEKEPRRYYLLRCCLMLLLMLSAGSSLLRLATSPPSFSSLVQPPRDTLAAETSRDVVDPLKTHISSVMSHLQAHEEESSSSTALSCPNLIDGMTSLRTTSEGLLCCDRSHYRTDVCYMRGDIRTDAQSSSILLYGAGDGNSSVEKIRPYTRKWETGVMNTVDEIKLRPMSVADNNSVTSQCDVHHKVPAIVFSTGGYTGNVYHELNDGLIPLYITAERFEGEVVLVVLEFHSWWKTKFSGVLEKLSNYKLVDFSNDPRVHCFTEMIVGLKIHGELTVDPKLMHNGKGIQDFQSLLGQGFGARQSAQLQPQQAAPTKGRLIGRGQRPKLVIFIRNKSRVLQNIQNIIKTCERAGFDVQILNPKRTTPLSDIYAVLNSSHAMLAVHGAAITHFLFMRPGSVLIQIVPLGVDWAADAYYGEPARKMGLQYIAYKTAPEESSLYRQYDHRSPIIRNPDAITSKGWSETKKIYLEQQNVRLNLRKFSRLIAKVHSRIVNRLQAKI